MRTFRFASLFWALLSCLAHAQFTPPGFPPGTFQSRGPLDVAACSPLSPPSGGIFDSTSLNTFTAAVGGAWTVANAASPDCATNGSTFVESTSTSTHATISPEVVHTFSGVSVTLTLYVKQGVGTRNAGVAMLDSTFSFETQGGVTLPGCTALSGVLFTSFSGATASQTATAISGGWCKLTVTTNLVTASGLYLNTESFSGSSASYTGDGSSSIQNWGLGVASP